MKKIIAMIPARLGSQRIKAKNLRLIEGKPLVAYIIESAVRSEVFDEIYINSEAEIFEKIALKYKIRFYKRSAEFASDDATNDMLVYDFLKNIDCGVLIQTNPTSPLYTQETIRSFVKEMIKGGYDAMHAVKEEKIETIFRGKPLNFDMCKEMPRSQDLDPIIMHGGGLMGWKKEKFIANMERYGCGTYGCAGKVGFFPLKGFEQIDIDEEEDFLLATLAMRVRLGKAKIEKRYFGRKR